MARSDSPLDGTQAHAHWLTGKQMGTYEERERILNLACDELDNCDCENALLHLIEKIRGQK